jgi:hypothetical protein
MPVYYFDLHNGGGETRDEEGNDLPDDRAARINAIENIRSLLCGEVEDGLLDMNGHLVVRTAARGTVMQVSFAEAVMLTRER